LEAINDGRVPNVGDTWGFVRQERTRKVIEDLERDYEERVKAKVVARMPVKFGVLEEIFSGVKDDMLRRFKAETYEDSPTEDL
jgi:hypothetical protein